MSNDLISRNAVLSKIASDCEIYDSDGDIFYKARDIDRVINTMPTAYDVDKVVKQLEELKNDKDCKLSCMKFAVGLCENHDKAIKIVKAGGENEQGATNFIQHRDGSGDTGREKDGHKAIDETTATVLHREEVYIR